MDYSLPKRCAIIAQNKHIEHMTALKKFERLESLGLWREKSDTQRREVTVSFGNATLVIADSAGRPLTHWSLAAIERLNPGERPAVFAPDSEASETIEIDEAMMIDAIEAVRKAIVKSRPRPGRLRNFGLAASAASVLALGVFWLPGALVRQTIEVVPASKRAEIGATLLGHAQRVTGSSCRNPLGLAALETLRERLFPGTNAPHLLVVPDGIKGAMPLPGNIILLNRQIIEQTEDPAVTAGYVLTARSIALAHDPLEAMLKAAGLRSTLTLLTTGNLPADLLRDYAEALVTAPGQAPDLGQQLDLFEAAEIPTEPYALALDPSGETVLDLIEADPLSGERGPVVLSDGDWVALQGICSS